MGMTGEVALVLARKFTTDTVKGLGELKGAPCTIKSQTETDDSYIITFEWTDTSGASQTSELTIKKPKDGFSPTITEDAGNTDDVYKLVVTNKDGSITTPNLKGGAVSSEKFTRDDLTAVTVGGLNSGSSVKDKTPKEVFNCESALIHRPISGS